MGNTAPSVQSSSPPDPIPPPRHYYTGCCSTDGSMSESHPTLSEVASQLLLATAAHGVARAPSSAYVAVRVRKSILCMSMRYHIPSSGQNSCNSRQEAPGDSVTEQRTESPGHAANCSAGGPLYARSVCGDCWQICQHLQLMSQSSRHRTSARLPCSARLRSAWVRRRPVGSAILASVSFATCSSRHCRVSLQRVVYGSMMLASASIATRAGQSTAK